MSAARICTAELHEISAYPTLQEIVLCICTTKSIAYKSLNRPLGIQEFETTRIIRQSANEGGKVVSPTYRPRLHPEYIPGTHFC
jgi:hypothetical protein